MITRRSLITGLAGLIAAPAIARVADLMPVKVYSHILYGDGIHDDTDALRALIDRYPVNWPDGTSINAWRGNTMLFPNGRFRITKALVMGGDDYSFDGRNTLFIRDEPALVGAYFGGKDRPQHELDACVVSYGQRNTIQNFTFENRDNHCRRLAHSLKDGVYSVDSRAHAHAQRT